MVEWITVWEAIKSKFRRKTGRSRDTNIKQGHEGTASVYYIDKVESMVIVVGSVDDNLRQILEHREVQVQNSNTILKKEENSTDNDDKED